MRLRKIWCALFGALFAAVCGCVERTIEIRSDPPAAKVFLDGKFVGETGKDPLVIAFDHYGTREIAVRKEGFVPARKKASISPPIYQIFPLDFFFECLFPFTLNDRNEFSFKLEPLHVQDKRKLEIMEKELAARAEQTRKEKLPDAD